MYPSAHSTACVGMLTHVYIRSYVHSLVPSLIRLLVLGAFAGMRRWMRACMFVWIVGMGVMEVVVVKGISVVIVVTAAVVVMIATT